MSGAYRTFGEKKNAHKVLVGKSLMESYHLDDLRIDGRKLK
jgi:hypothetical protein